MWSSNKGQMERLNSPFFSIHTRLVVIPKGSQDYCQPTTNVPMLLCTSWKYNHSHSASFSQHLTLSFSSIRALKVRIREPATLTKTPSSAVFRQQLFLNVSMLQVITCFVSLPDMNFILVIIIHLYKCIYTHKYITIYIAQYIHVWSPSAWKPQQFSVEIPNWQVNVTNEKNVTMQQTSPITGGFLR